MCPTQMFPNITGWQYILQIQTVLWKQYIFCRFLRQQDFSKIYNTNIDGRVSQFLIYDSQMVNIQIVKSFSRPKDQVFKWWLIITPGEILPKSSMRSWQQYNIDKLYVYNFFKEEMYIKFSGVPVKKSDKIHRSTFQQIKYISIVFF